MDSLDVGGCLGYRFWGLGDNLLEPAVEGTLDPIGPCGCVDTRSGIRWET
jgi:hypothetical protein